MLLLEFEFGTFQFFSDIVIGRMNHGIHYDLGCNEKLVASVLDYYGINHTIGYISIRENDYSVDPMVYLHNKSYDNLACIGIVENKSTFTSTVHLESRFFTANRLVAFDNKVDALEWANKLIKEAVENNKTYRAQ